MKYQIVHKLIAAVQAVLLIAALFTGGLSVPVVAASKSEAGVTVEISKAVSDGQNGALIEWQSSFEVGNLGYNVYRTGKRETVLVNNNLIPGSAFIVGYDKPLFGGHTYSFFDRGGTLDSQYIIEAVLTDGSRQTLTVVQTGYDAEGLTRSYTGDVKSDDAAGENLYDNGMQDGSKPSDFTVSNDLTNPVTQRWVAAQPGLKIAVKTNGLYRITRQQLADAGFDVNVPTANWQIYTDGIEQAFLISGEQGGILGANGYIEFYGYGNDTAYTDTRIFYLVVGTSPGKRMQISWGMKPKSVAAPSYSSFVQCKTSVVANCDKPTFYSSNFRNGEAENFYGDIIFNTTTPTPIRINVPSIDTAAAQATVEVSVQGFSTGAHFMRVMLNGAEIGTLNGGGYDLMRGSFTVPVSSLAQGENSVMFNVPNTGDTSLVEYVRIRYKRRYIASNNNLLFSTAYQRKVKVEGFASSDFRVFDVTDVNNAGVFGHQTVEENGTFSAVVATRIPRLLHAVSTNSVLTPAAMTANVPSNLYNTTQNKDLIIVTHKNWRTQAEALATYRQGQGLTTAVADVEDVFDEFSFGAVTPYGVKEFFRRAMPDYALLMGDATIDPKNYLNRPANIPNYMPSFLFDSINGETVSDELLGDFLDDNGNPGSNNVAEFPVGRLPVRDAAQAQILVNKIINFEQALPANPFERGAVFVNDDPIGYDFFATNQNMASRLPTGTAVQHIQRNGATPATAGPVRTAIVNAVNQGPFIVGYAGHGSLTTWTSASVLRSAEVAQFTNGTNNRFSIFFMLTCLNGSFADPGSESIAESLIKPQNGGAVAVWSSSGLTIADGQDVMAERFYDLHRQAAAGTRMGDLTKPARLASFDPDVRASWILFGDPTLKVR